MWQKTRLTELFAIELPIVCGAFGGGPSTVALAAAVSNAGGLGAYGANSLTPEAIRTVIAQTKAATSRPFVVNLWLPKVDEPAAVPAADFEAHSARLAPLRARFTLPDPAAPAHYRQPFEAQIAAALEAAPPAISFIMGVPPRAVVDDARRRGIKVLGVACTVAEARALEEGGVDAIVASGSDAGGHRGAFLRPAEESLVGTFSLVPQVVDAVRLPVIAAGGVADGRGVAAALALGADGVQVGTAFLMCTESAIGEAYRQVLESERAGTTVLTRAYTGRHARGVPNELYRALAPVEGSLPGYPVQGWLTAPIRKASGEANDPECQSLWAGQAARLARRRTAAECVRDLVEQTTAALKRVKG